MVKSRLTPRINAYRSYGSPVGGVEVGLVTAYRSVRSDNASECWGMSRKQNNVPRFPEGAKDSPPAQTINYSRLASSSNPCVSFALRSRDGRLPEKLKATPALNASDDEIAIPCSEDASR
jgi:hypothetical protein